MEKPQRRMQCPGTSEQVRGDHGNVIQRERALWEDCLLGAVGSGGGTHPSPGDSTKEVAMDIILNGRRTAFSTNGIGAVGHL